MVILCGVVAVYLSIGQVGQDSNALLNVVERRTVEERLVAFQEANPQVGLVVAAVFAAAAAAAAVVVVVVVVVGGGGGGDGGDAAAVVGGGSDVVGVVTV